MPTDKVPDDGLHNLIIIGTGTKDDPKRVGCTRCLLTFALGQSIIVGCNWKRETIMPAESSLRQKAREIVDAFIRDLTNRSGLRQCWEGIDEKTQNEILINWIDIVEERLKV